MLLQVCNVTVQQRHVAVPFETLESKQCFVTPPRNSKVQNASFSLHFGCSTRVVRATTSNFLATTLESFSVLFASLKNCLRGTFTTFGSTLRQLCKQPPGIRSGFCGIGFLKIAHFWWRMVCSQVICDQLEVCYAKKDLRNEFFRRFCVDPCVFYFFLKRISMSESLRQKNVNRIEANQGFGSRFA